MRSLNVFTKKFRYSLFLLPFVMHVPLNSLFCIFIVSYFTLFGKMALQPLHMPRVIVVAFNIYYSSTRWRGFSSHRFRRIWNTVKLWVVSRRRWKKMFKFALVSHFSWWLVKPKAVVSLRSYFAALGTGYKYLLSRILIGFTLLLVIGCLKLSRYSFNQSPTCDKSVYHVVFSLAFIPEFCFLRCCCCCFCVFRDWFGST